MKIVWVSEHVIIPLYGEVKPGDIKELPDGLAKLFIDEGMAKKHAETKKQIIED